MSMDTGTVAEDLAGWISLFSVTDVDTRGGSSLFFETAIIVWESRNSPGQSEEGFQMREQQVQRFRAGGSRTFCGGSPRSPLS